MLNREQIREIAAEAAKSMDSSEIAEMAFPSYLHWNPAVRWIIRKRLAVIADCMRRRGIKSFLDFGCGSGVLLHEMSGSCDKVYGTDIFLGPSQANVRIHKLGNVTLLEADKFSEGIEKSSLDGIVAADVLEHVDDVTPYINTYAELLKKDGVFFLSGPTENIIYRACRMIARFKEHFHVRDVYDIERSLEKLGWTLDELIEIPVFSPFKLFRVSIWKPPGGVSRN